MSQRLGFMGTIGFIGAGRMATALARGFVANGQVGSNQMLASDPDPNSLAGFAASLPGCRINPNNAAVASQSELLFLAVKPQFAKPAFQDIDLSASQTTVVSVMAGVRISAIESWLQTPRIIRAMPNTPCLIGTGAIGVAAADAVPASVHDRVVELLRVVGKVVVVSEPLLDAVTGLSGSGPAFVFTFLRGMIEGGQKAGLSPADARTLAIQTVIGAAKLMDSTETPAQDLIDQVSSPGGTTVEGLRVLRNHDFENLIANAVIAAARRATELGDEFI